MPISKFRPDPNTVQSGYYNDRNGTPDAANQVKAGESPLTSATKETAHTVQTISKALQQSGVVSSAGGAVMAGGGAPSPAAVMQMMTGQAPKPSADDNRHDLVKTMGGWYVPANDPLAQSAAVDEDGLVSFGFDDGLQKAAVEVKPESSDDPNEPDMEEQGDKEDQPDQLQKKKVKKGSGVQKSMTFFEALAAGKQLQKAGKTGEGSRGGKIIGHTSSGKPIYAGIQRISGGKDWSAMDHSDAQVAHAKQWKEHKDKPSGKDAIRFTDMSAQDVVTRTQHHERQSDFHRKKAGEIQDREAKEAKTAKKNAAHAAKVKQWEAEGHSMFNMLGAAGEEKKRAAEAAHEKIFGKGSGVPGAIQKGNDMSGLEDFIQKSEAEAARERQVPAREAGNILDDFLQKAAGQGGLPASGGPRKDLPRSLNPEDGGNLAGKGKGSGAQDAGPETVGSYVKKDKMQGNLYENTGLDDQAVGSEDLEEKAKTGGASKMAKGIHPPGQWVDWSKAAETSSRIRSMLYAQLANQDTDVTLGLGVAPDVEHGEQEGNEVHMVQKGILYTSDRDDQRIEKAMEQYADGGLAFHQTAAVNLNGQLQKSVQCPTCETITKSMYATCQGCGSSLNVGSQASRSHGLHLGPELQKAIVIGEEEDVLLG